MKKTFLFFTLLIALSTTTKAQYARNAVPCSMITQSQLKIYLEKLNNLVKVARQDKDKYGTSGAYPATANQFHLYATIAYDSLQATVNWLNTGSNNNPENTNYVEAMSIKNRMAEIITQLIAVNHWAELSAIYHKSAYAACGREEAMKLLVEAVNLLAYSSQCYYEPYKKDIPPPNCK
jgi:hypothetical protein